MQGPVGSVEGFGDLWLDSARKQTLLPGSPWYNFQENLSLKLSESIIQQFSSEPVLQKICLCHLLGKAFVEKYLPASWQDHHDVSQMKDDLEQNAEFDAVLAETKQWLIKEVSKAADDLSSSKEFNEFYHFGLSIFDKNTSKKLASVEHDVLERRNMRGQAGKQAPRHTWGHQTETLGQSLSALVRSRPGMMREVCKKLLGRQLRYTLRETIWQYQLINNVPLQDTDETELADVKGTENTFMELVGDFKKKFQSSIGVGDVNIIGGGGVSGGGGGAETNKKTSGISGIIQQNVQESYHSLQGVRESDTKRLINMACIVLDLLYITNQNYEPHLPLVLVPLLLVFYKQRQMLPKEEIAVRLVVNLQQMIRLCLPSLPLVFSISEQVIKTLRKEDSELYDHLISACQTKSPSESEEFLIHYMHSEKTKARELDRGAMTGSNPSLGEDTENLLAHPVVFIRKWLTEGFVGSLDMRAVLFIWDQCFMMGWSSKFLEVTCLTLLELLKTLLLKATEYQQVKEVLFYQPALLYTLHIQKGIMYLYNGGSLLDIPSMVKDEAVFDEEPSEHESPRDTGVQESPSPSLPGPSVEGAGEEPETDIPERATTPELSPFWVEYQEPDEPNEVLSPSDPFDVYIDAVRFIPDNATIVKITGRIFHPNWDRVENFEDVQAVATLDSPARCPDLNFRFTMRPGTGGVSPFPDGLLVLRAYTVDFFSEKKDLVVIGSCVFRLYDTVEDEVRLRVGGYQLHLYHSLPTTDRLLTEKLFGKLTKCPATSLLLRILPHSESAVSAPLYSSGYYDSESCRPTESEENIYQHYLRRQDSFPALVRDALVELMEVEQVDISEMQQDASQIAWYKERLGKQRLKGLPATDLDLIHAITYDQSQGLAIQVMGAYGLPNAVITHALVYLVPGKSSEVLEVTEEGYGGEDKFMTSLLDLGSYPKSPRWRDKASIFHPHFIKNSFIIIQLYTMDVSYTPRLDRAGPGTLEEKKGKSPSLVSQGWAALPVFSKLSVNAGIHHVPLIQGNRPPVSFLDIASSYSVETSLSEGINQKVLKLQGMSSLKVRLFDAHYTDKECPPFPEITRQLVLVGQVDKYIKTVNTTTGKPLSDVVLRTLSKDGKKQGIAGLEYQRESEFFQESVKLTLSNLMDSVVLGLGLGPLEWTWN